MVRKVGCEVGAVNRQKIEDLKETVINIEKKIDISTKELSEKMTDLYNHQSSRLPMWTTIIIGLLSSIVTGLVVFLATHPV